MKKGIVLLITIGFITLLSAIIAYIFSLSNRAFDESRKSTKMDQTTILVFDIKKLLDSYTRDLNDSESLSRFLIGMPPFLDYKSGLYLDVKFELLSNKININSLLINKNIDKNIVIFLKKICEEYNILDSDFFIDLLLDTIDRDNISREAMSEIITENIKFSNGKIFDFNHFMTILNYYVQKVQDKNILKIPWRKLIYFGNNTYSEVDCDRMDKKLISTLGFNSEDFSGCSELMSPVYAQIRHKYHLKSFTKEKNYYILVKIYYKLSAIDDMVKFVYDIKKNKASNIEFF